MSSLSDIDADPVIDNGQVFAVGQGGRMVALELITGQRQWELNIAGIATPWVAGDWVFVVTDEAKLLVHLPPERPHPLDQPAAAVRAGQVEEGRDRLFGPVLAGGRLIVAGSNGALINVDPATGNFQSQTSVGAGDQPAAGGRQFDALHLDDSGRLHAFR